VRAPPAEWIRRVRAGLLPATVLVLAPKCALCLLAYAGLGTALGLGGPELCGGSGQVPGAVAPALSLLGGGAWFLRHRAARHRAAHCTAAQKPVLSGPSPVSPRR
jgi:hypothetical protein